MRRIRWTPEAAAELEAAVKYIQQDKPDAAQKLAQRLIGRVEQLATFPAAGRLGEVEGTREVVVLPLVVVYRHTDESVEILHIWHGAQDWR